MWVSLLLLILYRQAHLGLDTADAELWVFLTLVAIGLAWAQLRPLASICIIASYCAVYFFAGLNKLRSPAWRDGTALGRVTANDRDSFVGVLLARVPAELLPMGHGLKVV
ncbi:MAG TPA: hypothetical protein VMF55_01700 [Solirubrobacterales bacterium]|nr:hypothetical protein [Solirubrobacterales bacterium]